MREHGVPVPAVREAGTLGDLEATAPSTDLAHGDFCLPNIIIRREAAGEPRVAGFIDCGRAGVADRYQDIALGIRSIAYNVGESAVRPFLDGYGLEQVDQAKVELFQLPDEFF